MAFLKYNMVGISGQQVAALVIAMILWCQPCYAASQAGQTPTQPAAGAPQTGQAPAQPAAAAPQAGQAPTQPAAGAPQAGQAPAQPAAAAPQAGQPPTQPAAGAPQAGQAPAQPAAAAPQAGQATTQPAAAAAQASSIRKRSREINIEQSDLYREKTSKFVELAWSEEGDQALENFFKNEKEDSTKYFLELGELAHFNTSYYRERKLPADLVFVKMRQQDKILWLHKRAAAYFLANREEVSASGTQVLKSFALGWLQAAERQFPKMVDGKRPYGLVESRRLPVDRIRQGIPGEEWLELLPADVRLRIFTTLTRIYIAEGNHADVFEPIRDAAALNSRSGLQLATELLYDFDKIDLTLDPEDIIKAKAEARAKAQEVEDKPESEATTGDEVAAAAEAASAAEEEARIVAEEEAALERAKLEAKKRLLFEWLARLRAILPDGTALSSNAVMDAFADCHLPGQIYVRKDFDRLLSLLDGPKDVIVTRTSEIMGARIHTLWSEFNPASYEDPELAERVMFGAVREAYALLDDKLKMVLDDADPENPKRWQYAATLGRMRLDAADFYLSLVNVIEPWENDGKSVLRSFKLQRDAALEVLDQATDIYCEVVSTLTRAEYSPLVFIGRFDSIMKLTDIAMASLPAKLRDEELRSLRDDLLALEGHVAEGHFEALVKWFEQTYEGVEPKDKYRFLNSFVTVMGDNLVGARYKRKLDEYDNWRQEIQLHVRVDGDQHIGTGQEFGIFLSFRHSKTLGLDSDIKYYLAMQEYLDKFRADVMKSLHTTFIVKDVRYHETRVRPYGFGRDGWQETPLAYVVLAAKDPAIDRIPPIELNLEYPPPRGVGEPKDYYVRLQLTGRDADARQAQFERSVLLPVRSDSLYVNAHPDRRIARPCRDIAISQTFDDRNLEKGSIRLAVSARAKGLLPELEDLVHIGSDTQAIPGFKIADIRDLGIVLNSLDSSDELAADTTRRWTVELALDDMNRDKAKTFHFLAARAEDTEMDYRRYEDADVQVCESTIRLGWVPPNIHANARDILLGLIALVLLIVGFRFGAKLLSRPVKQEEYCLPEEITPFTVVTLAHRISGDRRIELSNRQRQELKEVVLAVERSYFAVTPEEDGVDLKSIANRWLAVAQESTNGKIATHA